MKYKVGDKVRVREDLEVGKMYGHRPFFRDMKECKGKQAIIETVYNDCRAYDIDIDELGYLWSNEMLENIAENGQNAEKVRSKTDNLQKKI